jgi:branched-chain amino acid transport system substrate-binding protein
MRKHWTGRLAAAIALAAVVAVAGCGGDDSSSSSGGGDTGAKASNKPVKIGVLAPFSGIYAVAGDPIKNGVDLWLKEHDNKLGGRPVQLEVGDDKSTPQGEITAANNLSRQKGVTAVVGLVNSAAALAARPTLTRSKTISMAVVANASELLDTTKGPYMFMVNAAANETSAASAVLAQKHGFKDVVGVADNYVGARTWLDPSLDAMKSLGMNVKDRIYPTFPTSDYGPYVSKVAKSNPGTVYPVMFGPSALAFVKTYASFGGKAPLYTTGSMLEPTTGSQDLLKAADGAYAYWNYSPWLDNPENAKFRDAYKAAYGKTPGGFEMQSYVSMEFLDKAYAEAGPDGTPDDVRQALQSVKIQSPAGELSFGESQAVNWDVYLMKVGKGEDGAMALLPQGPVVKQAHPDMTTDEAQSAFSEK